MDLFAGVDDSPLVVGVDCGSVPSQTHCVLVETPSPAFNAWKSFDADPSGAWFSDDLHHRLLLWRSWDVKTPRALFIMLNPSIAGVLENDPTLLQCIAFAKSWGCGGVNVMNIYSIIATDPKVLWHAEVEDRVASGFPLRKLGLVLEHDELLDEVMRRSLGVIVGAWGVVPAMAKQRVEAVRDVANRATRSVSCLGTTKGGYPKHPCRLSRTTGLEPFWRPLP